MRAKVVLFALGVVLLPIILTASAGQPEIPSLTTATPLPHALIAEVYVKFRGHTTDYWEVSDHIWVVKIEQLLSGSFYPCTLDHAHVIVYSPPPSPLYPPCDDGYVDPDLAVGDFVEVWGFRPWPDDSGDAGCAVNVCAHSSYYIRKWSASPTPTRTRTRTPTRTRTATPSRTSTRPTHRMRLPLLFRGYHRVP